MGAGSSPRGRGKQTLGRVQDAQGGLIPARAGKTAVGPVRGVGCQAHPRAGGENTSSSSCTLRDSGSSPRGRGKRQPARLHVRLGGLIPARAGKTYGAQGGQGGRPAHPRAGGENGGMIVYPDGYVGSSPRGRGKRHVRPVVGPGRGLIPARAGKTGEGAPAIGAVGAHPRAGGENVKVRVCFASSSGSSPRGRGKHHQRAEAVARLGLIPARAGKTMGLGTPRSRSAAHPRAGGENPVRYWLPPRRTGSSPRGRGKRPHDSESLHDGRLIPARAGKTLSDLRFYRADRSDLGNP